MQPCTVDRGDLTPPDRDSGDKPQQSCVRFTLGKVNSHTVFRGTLRILLLQLIQACVMQGERQGLGSPTKMLQLIQACVMQGNSIIVFFIANAVATYTSFLLWCECDAHIIIE